MTLAEIENNYRAQRFWAMFSNIWTDLAQCVAAESTLTTMRHKYVGRKGRKPGSKNKPKTVTEVSL